LNPLRLYTRIFPEDVAISHLLYGSRYEKSNEFTPVFIETSCCIFIASGVQLETEIRITYPFLVAA